jgi:hypothetical protein
MRESRLSGSVEGVTSNRDPYSDCLNRLGLTREFAAQGIEQCVQNDFQRLRALRQHPFHALPMYRQLSQLSSAAEVDAPVRPRSAA